MQAQLKSVHTESKGKSSSKVSTATHELQYLMNFNASITQAAAKTMGHLTEFVFISMGNLTLAHRDASLNHLKGGTEPDIVAVLRTIPLHIPTLFLDNVVKWEIAHFESKGQSASHGKGQYHPYELTDRRSDKRWDSKADGPIWKNIGKGQYKKPKGRSSNYSSRPAKGQQSYK